MNIKELSKPITAKMLNESLAKKFGQKINLSKFTLEQLQDSRNKLRTQLSQVETTESYDSVKSESYTKNKMFLDVLNAEIAERQEIQDTIEESVVTEGAEDQAELVMAAKDMVDRITGWLEDTAEMQTESMLELADAIRDEMGQEQSDAFVGQVKPALEQLYTTMEGTRDALTGGVGILTGEGAPVDTMGAEDDLEAEPEMEPTIDGEEEMDMEPEDDFGAAEPATGGDEEADRAKRESVERSRRLGTILSKKK